MQSSQQENYQKSKIVIPIGSTTPIKQFADTTNDVHLQKRSFDQAFVPTSDPGQQQQKPANSSGNGVTIRLNFSMAAHPVRPIIEETTEDGEISDPQSNYTSEVFDESPEAIIDDELEEGTPEYA